MHWSKSKKSKEVREKIKAKRALQVIPKRSEKSKEQMSLKMKGNKNAVGAKSEEHKESIRKAKMGKPCKWLIGEKNPNWKGGLSDVNSKIRSSLEYKIWRRAVFQRDNYTCVWCLQKGGKLNADHIKPFADYPELRFAIDNGRTLCVECHRKTDTYGSRLFKTRLI